MSNLYAYDRDMRELEKRLAKQEQLLADVCLDIVAHQKHHRDTVEDNIRRHEEKIGQLEQHANIAAGNKAEDRSGTRRVVSEAMINRKAAMDAMYKPDKVSAYKLVIQSEEIARLKAMADEQADLLNEMIEQRNQVMEERDDAVSERDTAWEELRKIRKFLDADEEESTFDEVCARVAEMDRRIGDALMNANEQLHQAMQGKQDEMDDCRSDVHVARQKQRAAEADLSHLREQLTQLLSGQDNCTDHDLIAMVQNALNYAADLRKRLIAEKRSVGLRDNSIRQLKIRSKTLRQKLRDCRSRLRQAETEFPRMVQHPDDVAVARFADALGAKMKSGREKGRSGWDSQAKCPTATLANMFMDHLNKGNPGNFEDLGCLLMMLHQRGEAPRVLWQEVEYRRNRAERAGASRMASRLLSVATVLEDSPTRHRLLDELKDAKRMVLEDMGDAKV